MPLCLGPNSVAERINPPSEILGRQPVCPTRISRLIYVATSVTHPSPTSFSGFVVLSLFKKHPGKYLARGYRGKEVRGLAPSASGQILSLSGAFTASGLTK